VNRGFFAIGIHEPKREVNVGSLFRSASLYNAAFIFTVGRRYKSRQSSDTPHARMHTPLFHFESIEDLHAHLPWSTPLVGVELDPRAQMLGSHVHHERAAYLLGAEDHGLPLNVLDQCSDVLQIPTPNPASMNVSCAGAVIMHDRFMQMSRIKEAL
jgi:tRNA G18 (ribose-2'-O)-methylase SpoU